MSDKEEKKWLRQLNQNTPGHLYKLDAMPMQKDQSDEKPW